MTTLESDIVERQPRFRLLLAGLVGTLVAEPLLTLVPGTGHIISSLSLVVFGAAVIDLHFNRTLFRSALVFVALAIAIRVGLELVDLDSLLIGSHALATIFFAFTLAVVSWAVMRPGRMNTDRVVGAVCVYLLVGIVFAHGFGIVVLLEPQALSLSPDDIEVLRAGNLEPATYFSFVTLTTLGYGDILPVSSAARAMAWIEAVIGQLYVAVTIARLVSLETAAGGSTKNPVVP